MATPNALFAIVSVAQPALIEQRLTEVNPWVSWKLQDGQWLLIAPTATTTKEISDRLGLGTEEPLTGTGLVLRVENYFGRHPRSLWEWIATKQGADLGTTA